MRPPQTTFVLDEMLLGTVDDLRGRLKLSSREEVITRALALLKLAAEAESDGGSVVIERGGRAPKRIQLS